MCVCVRTCVDVCECVFEESWNEKIFIRSVERSKCLKLSHVPTQAHGIIHKCEQYGRCIVQLQFLYLGVRETRKRRKSEKQE